MVATLAAVALAATASVPAAGSNADGPRATAATKCKPVRTQDGGRSAYVRTVGRGLRCRRARRVAARADGASYRALGFSCAPSGEPTSFGILYGCGALVDGRRLGIGFLYKGG